MHDGMERASKTDQAADRSTGFLRGFGSRKPKDTVAESSSTWGKLLDRQTFLAAAERALAQPGAEPVVLILNVDEFREINHSLGHAAGDIVLQEVGKILVHQAMNASFDVIVGRMGADEFGLLLVDAWHDDASALAHAAVKEIRRPIAVEQVKVSIDASIGVAQAPRHGNNMSALMSVAEAAMLRAKQAKTGVVWGSLDVSQETPQSRLVLMGDLGRAMDEQELQVYFQPKMKLENRSLHGVEALVRWPHPVYGFVSPAEFVVAAEQTGQIHELTKFVLDTSLRQCREWFDQRIEIRVAVNVSTRNLLDPSFSETVRLMLAKHSMRGEYLVLEITEGTLMKDPDRGRQALERIRRLGVEIALDDFGTGFSSLSYLNQLPIDELKIDRSFLAGIEEGSPNLAILKASIQLGKDLGKRVVVEGIETEGEFAILKEMGCEIGQGYLLGRPMPGHEIPLLVVQKMRFVAPRPQ
jgi:diguanylate cyclase (GGDEF)-like protein